MSDTNDSELAELKRKLGELNRAYSLGAAIYANYKGAAMRQPPSLAGTKSYYSYGNANLYEMAKMPYQHGFTSFTSQVKRMPGTAATSFANTIKGNVTNFRPSTYTAVVNSTNLSNVGKVVRVGGKALGALGTVVTVASDINDNWADADFSNMSGREIAERTGHTVTDVGVDIAATAGCVAAGAAIGSVVPVFGTAIGAIIGFGLGVAINLEFGEPPKSLVGWAKEGARWAVDRMIDAGAAVVDFFSGIANWRDQYGQSSGPQDRDFTQATKQKLLGIVSQLEKECGGVLDYVGDAWKAAGLPTAKDYTTKLLDIKNTSKSDIEKVFAEVAAIDTKFVGTFNSARDAFRVAHGDLQTLCDRIRI
jgi:hypothetical protein